MTEPTMETPPFADCEQALAAAEARLLRALTKAPRPVRTYTTHLAHGHGKLIRARALIACSQRADRSVPADAAALAAAVELLHLATLVHDDVIDDADLRRGVPTLHSEHGPRTAVICGDYLLGASLRMASELPDREVYLRLKLPDYVGRVCLGELRQQIANRNFDLGVPEYLRIIGGKTAALFEGAFGAGAILCTADERLRRRYRRLGRNVGMIFQLTDDCIDFELDQNTARKPVRSDFEQGVITLPMIWTFERDADLLCRAKAGVVCGRELGARVRAGGGLDYARALSRRYYGRAKGLIIELAETPEKARRLTELLDLAYWGPKSL